jgi:hypothetical protein
VARSPLHDVVNFPGCWLLWRLNRFLLYFQLGFEEDGAIFCAVVGFTAVVHAVWRFYGVWASAMTAATIWSSASLSVLGGCLIEGP